MGRIGTIRIQTNSGIVDVPVFDIGDSGSSVTEALRVQTNSGTGFVPLVDPVDAAVPQKAIRVQTGSGIKSVTDSATIVPVVDTFEQSLYEDQGLSLSDRYSIDLSNFSRQQSTVFEGSYALEATTDGNEYILNGDNLPNSFAQGDTVEFYINNAVSCRPAFAYGIQGSGSDWYGAAIEAQNSQIAIFKDSFGGKLTGESISISENKFYRGELSWGTDDSHELTVHDPSDGSLLAGPISVTDSTYTSGGTGWILNSNNSATAIFDGAQLI